MTYGSDMSFPYYPALDGSALEGVAYFGVAGQNPVTNPVTVFWDSAGTQPAAQPVTISKGRTVRSDGTPSRVWVASDYSVLVQDTLGRQVVFEPNQPVTIAALNAINQATAQVGLAAAQVALATAQTGLATGQAVAASGSASAALGYSNAATAAATTAGVYPNAAASNVPRGLTQASVGAITAGSGGTNGTFALAWSSGNFSINPTGTYTVAGGVLTAVTITGPGLYIGSSATVPTPSFAASSGLSGAAVAITAQFLVTSGQGYWVQSADSTRLDRYKNASGVATADATVQSILVGTAVLTAASMSQTNLSSQNSHNDAALHAQAALFSRTISDNVTNSGDSIMLAGSAGNTTLDVLGDFVSGASLFNVAVSGTRSDQILATFLALPSTQKDDYGFSDGGINDVTQTVAGVTSATITAAGSGGTDGTYTVPTTGGAGTAPITQASYSVTITGGAITAATPISIGGGFSTAPTFSLAGIPGLTGATLTANLDIVATVESNISALMTAAGANRLLLAPWPAQFNADAYHWARSRRIVSWEKVTYGARVLDGLAFLSRFHSNTETGELEFVRAGEVPASITVDRVHPNDGGVGILGREMARMLRAYSGVGAPYIHDELSPVGAKNGDAAGTAILTPRSLGTPKAWRIIQGNTAGAVRINATTGALTRGAGALPSILEIFARTEGIRKGSSNIARWVVVRQMDGTSPQSAVRITGNNAQTLAIDKLGGTQSKKMTIVLCARIVGSGSAQTIVGAEQFSGGQYTPTLSRNDNVLNAAPYTPSFSLIGGVNLPTAASPGAFNFYFVTMDTSAAILKAVTNESAANSATPTANAVYDFSVGMQLFGTATASLNNVDVKMLWISQEYLDITDSAVRALFYASATGLPLDLGASGVVSGVTPLVYMRGMAGDYMMGKNFGSAGDFFATPYINQANVAFTDVAG